MTYGSYEAAYGAYDQVVYLSNVSWADYERIDALRGESAVPRLTYVEGVLELISPGTPHESDKTKLARIFEAVIEVVHASGGLDKLEVWRKLGAKEVWFWWRGGLDVFVRKGDAFAPARRSALVPAVDLELVVRCMHEPTQRAAVQALRAALAKKRG